MQPKQLNTHLSNAALTIRPLEPNQSPLCEQILRALPEWFGIESALMQYVQDTRQYPTWLAEASASTIVAFLTLREHFPRAAEIHCLAVLPAYHRQGIGRTLITHVESICRAQGIDYLQVKTLGPSRPNEPYARTRAFYENMGFTPLEEIPNLWPGNPCLLMVKRL